MRKLLSSMLALSATLFTLVAAAPADAASRYRVTAHASAGNLDVGKSFTLKGKVRPKAPGQKVKIQRWTGSHWAKVAKTRLNQHSRYTTTIELTAPGDNRYRVVKPTSSGHKKGVSPAVTVVGWRWRSLLSLPHDTRTSFPPTRDASNVTSVTFGGLTFSPAVKLGSPSATTSYVTYRLDGLCTELDSHVGKTEDSATTTGDTVQLYVNPVGGNNDYLLNSQQVVVEGDPVHLYRGPDVIASADGVSLQNLAGAGNYLAWADPRVYCRS